MKLKALVGYFGSVKCAYQAKEKDLIKVLGVKTGQKFIEFRSHFDPVKKLEEIKRKEIKILCLEDEEYPTDLKNIPDPPICLYIKGSALNLSDSTSVLVPLRTPQVAKKVTSRPSLKFAIVGTRRPTPYGIQVARKFASELASAGFVIVSGLAYGIDAIAHQASLEAGGKTIAVLGCGVDVIYPYANNKLYRDIVQGGGAVISEFPPGQFVLKGLFVVRNRIISALSQGVMVVEGGKNSGSLITARFAAEQGKDVFAPPNPITSDMAAAPNLLLKEGAKLATSVEDIFEEFNIRIVPRKKEDILTKLNLLEKRIFLLLNERSLLIDDLVVHLQQPIGKILNELSLLEIKGLIEKSSSGRYQVKLR
ncbi:DNA-processing protein DprA [Patescibacteria group bacterium]|nr:DNA-processing protein DprA [Patescibacteria group bacterium]